MNSLESVIADFHANRTRRSKAYTDIVETIWQAIEHEKLAVGDKLPSEKDLARLLNVARPTLREALSVLHYLGVVDCVQGGGYFIKTPTSPTLGANLAVFSRNVSIFDVVTARLAIEPETCRLAAGSRSEDDLLHMRGLLDKVPAAGPGHFPIDIDTAFHAAIGRATGNPLLASVVESLLGVRNQLWALYTTLQSGGRGLERYIDDPKGDHERVFTAIKDRDEAGAHQAMAKHLNQVKDCLFGSEG